MTLKKTRRKAGFLLPFLDFVPTIGYNPASIAPEKLKLERNHQMSTSFGLTMFVTFGLYFLLLIGYTFLDYKWSKTKAQPGEGQRLNPILIMITTMFGLASVSGLIIPLFYKP